MEWRLGEVILELNHLIMILKAMLDIELENWVSGHQIIVERLVVMLDSTAVNLEYQFVTVTIQLIAN